MRQCRLYRHGLRARDAFSLVEMMAALVIFSVGVVALIEVITTSLRASTTSIGYTQAVYLARQTMDEAILDADLEPGEMTGDFALVSPRHKWKRTIEETERSGLHNIRVDITWDDGGRERTYSLSTIVGDR